MTPTTLHEFERGPNAVSHALDLVARFIEVERPGCDDVLAVIVEELVCNLVDHGIENGAGHIGLALRQESGGVHLTLIDGCVPFDPRDGAAVAERPPERGGGCGLALVREWARILSYERVGNRNRLELLVPG